METPMRNKLGAWLAVTLLSTPASMAVQPAQAFCGFYVAKADAKLFNKASKVVVARKGSQGVCPRHPGADGG